MDIWHGEKMQQFRKFHRTKKLEKNSLCGQCSEPRTGMIHKYKTYKMNQKLRRNYLNNHVPVV